MCCIAFIGLQGLKSKAQVLNLLVESNHYGYLFEVRIILKGKKDENIKVYTKYIFACYNLLVVHSSKRFFLFYIL